MESRHDGSTGSLHKTRELISYGTPSQKGSLDTVNIHLKHIYRKLSVHRRVEAILAFSQAK